MKPDSRPENALAQWPHVRAYTARLRDLRARTGTTQAQLAAVLGTSQTMYGRYERGANEFPLHHLAALCRYFGVTAGFLLGLEGPPDA